jgi:hypothetical protein
MEFADIMSTVLTWGVFLFGLGVCLLGLAATVYVAYRFMSLVVSMEAGILKEFGRSGKAVNMALEDIPKKEAKLREFIQARMAPTEGGFEPYDDETAFLNEQVMHLREKGLTDEELDAFIRQAVGTDIGKPETG